MHAVLNIVLPVFGIILAGYLSRRTGLLAVASTEALNRFVYFIALPPLLFLSTAQTQFDAIINGPFIVAYILTLIITLIITLIGAWCLFGHRTLAMLTAHSFAAIFANTVYMGFPLFLAAFGREGMAPVVVGSLISNILIIAPVIVFMELSRTTIRGAGQIGRDVVLALVRSPILVPLLIGLAVSYFELTLPVALASFLTMLSNAAGPSALFALGMSLFGLSFNAEIREVSWLVVIKLLIHPLIAYWLAFHVFDLPLFWAQASVLVAAIPTGSLVFVISQKYGVYIQRSAAAIVGTTLLSVLTLAGLIAWIVP